MKTGPRFELTKWYADCVSGEGEVLIAYAASLRHRRLAVHYESLLSRTETTHSLRRSDVVPTGDEVQWSSPGLGLHGNWERRCCEIRQTLFENPEGAVEWHCLMPKGEARMERAARETVSGLGYVEHLRLTIPPWRLPIRRLRWGRYLSARHTVVWIDWEGEFSTRLVYRDGRQEPVSAIANDGMVFGDGARLELDRGLVLRRGRLGSTVLHAIPGLDRIAPSRILLMDECKWRSRGILSGAGGEADSGWSIHEEVTWP